MRRLADIWTLRRATGVGCVAGLAALLLWPAYAVMQETARIAFVAALALTLACGLSILAMTATDLLTVTRDRRILPARLFDLVLGALLVVPPALALAALLS